MKRALMILALAAAAPLVAQGSESWLGLAPCELCLWQRWPYWVAMGFAALALALPRHAGVLLGLAGLAALTSGVLGGFHLGVEQGFWPSPLAGCKAATAGAAMSIEDMLKSLAPTPNKPCDAPAFLIPGLPISMAAMNMVYGLGLGAFALRLARQGARA
ncbi:MAG: disulfide bond formation protein B [Roseomonas sp.]|nr:disulfide bond formation protein B [Roseomonas sp.]MCA3327800.1 disulfide bond formation protein B [Roseomonas sp.]MCA3329652.1 disulfide bond formation protein B [Roseomonas sp.]MCA3334491.1 disulfide bond formation protein B [Roseomonas sp.]MCA3345407.1 disulfide bond formation protein B [Roseomonas sp.]